MPGWAKVSLIVVGSLVLLVVIADKLVMPAIVHSQRVVSVPNVVGQPAAQAVRTLTQGGFVIAKADTHADERFPAGTVLFQNPYGGAEVKEGRNVFLTVSSGRELLVIPNVAGVLLREAKIRLQMAGCTIGGVSYENTSSVPDETVLRQSPSGGAHGSVGAVVSLVVSNGPEQQTIGVPQLVGITLAEAQERIRAAKLVFGQISYRNNRSVLPGTVLEQRPASGDSVKEGSPVHVIVAGD